MLQAKRFPVVGDPTMGWNPDRLPFAFERTRIFQLRPENRFGLCDVGRWDTRAKHDLARIIPKRRIIRPGVKRVLNQLLILFLESFFDRSLRPETRAQKDRPNQRAEMPGAIHECEI